MKSFVNAPLAVATVIALATSNVFAQGAPPLQFTGSVSVGPIGVELRISKPVAHPAGGVMSTIVMTARNETTAPPSEATLTAIGTAADATTLLGGFVPATIVVKRDLLAGQSFADAVADAKVKTGVTIISLQDASMVEYALLLFAVLIVSVASFKSLSANDSTSSDLAAILAKLQSNFAAIGFTTPVFVQ